MRPVFIIRLLNRLTHCRISFSRILQPVVSIPLWNIQWVHFEFRLEVRIPDNYYTMVYVSVFLMIVDFISSFHRADRNMMFKWSRPFKSVVGRAWQSSEIPKSPLPEVSTPPKQPVAASVFASLLKGRSASSPSQPLSRVVLHSLAHEFQLASYTPKYHTLHIMNKICTLGNPIWENPTKRWWLCLTLFFSIWKRSRT